MTVGGALGGSEGGFSPDNPTSSDFYAPGDARLPANYGTYTRKGKIKRKRKRKSRRK